MNEDFLNGSPYPPGGEQSVADALLTSEVAPAVSPVNDGEFGSATPGYYDAPTEYAGLPSPTLQSDFQNPYAPIPDLQFEGQKSFDLDNAMNALANKKPSFQAATAPVFFDWDKTQADRYVNSDYYKEMGFLPGRDNETLYGNRQTFGDTMQQAFSGMGSLTWNSFWEGWKGWGNLVDALFNWGSDKGFRERLLGSPEDLEVMEREQRDIMNKYAIFRTPESENTIFNRQFLGDLIQQGGFALGTSLQFLAEELLTAGVSSFFKPATAGLKLAESAKWIKTGEMTAAMKRLNDFGWKTKGAQRLYEGLKSASTYTKFIPLAGNVVDTGLEVMQAVKKGAGPGKRVLMSLNGLRRTMSEANMAFTESRMEAAGTYGELKDKLYQAALNEKGEVTYEDQQRIEKMAQGAAWSNFLVNAGVISIMNRMEYDNLFRKFGADKRATREMLEAGELAAKDTIDPKFFQKVTGKAAKDVGTASGMKAGQEFTKVYEKGALGSFGNLRKVAADFGRKQAAWEATKSFGRNMFKWEVGEGLQELVQEGSNIAIQQYYTDLYMAKPGDPQKGTSDYVDKAIQDLSNTNGLKVFLSGALMGHLLSPIHRGFGAVQDRVMTTSAQRQLAQANRQQTIADLNQVLSDPGQYAGETIKKTIQEYYRDPSRYAPENIANLKVQNRASEVMEAALKGNNKYLYEHAKDSAFAKAVMAAKKLNMLESLTDTIRAYGDHFDEKEFYEAFKVDFKGDEDRRSVKEYMDKMANDIQAFSDRYDLLRYKFADFVSPERYAGADRDKMRMVKRALDDTIEWMAVSEYRANRTVERGLKILEEASKLPTIGPSAHLIFRLLGDNESLRGEINILDQEIASLKESNLDDEATKKQLELKEEQRRILDRLSEEGEGPANQRDKEEAIKVNFEIMEPDVVIGILRDFANAKNKELGNNTEVMPDDAAEVYFKLRDYRQLSKDQKSFLDVYAYMADQKGFERTFIRILEGQQYLRDQQIAAANGELKPKNQSGSAVEGRAVINDLTEDELQAGVPLEDYHGFRVGDKIRNTVDGSEYIIVRMTTTGIQWQDSEDDAIKGIMDLDRFDKLVGANKIVKVAEEKPFNVEFGPDENKQLIDGLDGVFIVKDSSREKPFVLTDENNQSMDESGQLVKEGEDPPEYTTEEEAKEARDKIINIKTKAQAELDAPFEFDGKPLKYGAVLVGPPPEVSGGEEQQSAVGSGQLAGSEHQSEVGGKKLVRYKVVTKGTPAADENAPIEKMDSIQLQLLGSKDANDIFSIDSMKGYELATEAAQRRKAGNRDGAYRIPSIHYLVQAQGVPQNGESQEEANQRLQEIIRKTAPKDLQEQLVIRVSKNPNQKTARLAREGKPDQNDNLEEHDSNLIAELRFNNETIGYLPYFDQYNYKDENEKVKIPDLTVEQFQAMVDTGDQNPYALLAEFQRYYEEARKVYDDVLSKEVRDNGHKDIKGEDLKKLFTVYSSAGDNRWVEKAETPLKDLAYSGVGGKRVLLIQPLTRDEKGMSNRKTLVVVGGGLNAEEQKKLEELIQQERNKKGYDVAAGLGEYVAVIELPNKELRFVPLDLPSMTAKDMDAVVQRINEQSKETKEKNLVVEDDVVREDSGSFNAEFNGGLLKEFFIHVPALGRGLWVDLSLNPKGDLLVSFRNANKGNPQFILLQGGAQVETPLSFSSFSDLLSKINAAIQTHDAPATAKNRIGLELTEAHFKKHLADLNSNQPGARIDFGAVANMPAFVHQEVINPAVLTVTSNSDTGDPLDIFFRNLMARAEEDEAANTQTPPNKPGQPPSGGNSGSNNNPKNKKNKKKNSSSKNKKNTGNNNKGASSNNNSSAKKAEGLISEMMRLEKEVETLPNEIYLELLDAEEKKQADEKEEGVDYKIDYKALRDQAENDPKVKAKKDRITAIRAEIKNNRRANKVLTHEALSQAHVEEIDRFEKWMDANLPDFIDVETKDLIIQNMGQYGITVGQFIYSLTKLGAKKEISIVTDPNAPYKYHEAFHAVFRLLLTDDQIDRLLFIARKEVKVQLREKKTTMAAELEEMRRLAPEYYAHLSDEELEERYYEEHLADRFDHWKSDTEAEKDSWLKQFFRWLYDQIRRFNKNFAKGELEDLFREINAGTFKEARLAVNRFTKEARETLATQVVLKSIKIGEIGVRDEDGEEMLVNEYLPEAKGTALTSAIAGTYYDRMMRKRTEEARKSDESSLRDSSGNAVPDAPDAGVAAEDVLEQVLNDYAQLYDRDHPKYLAKLSKKETAREYWAMLPELDKLKRLFENGREELKDAVRVHLRQMNLMQSEEQFRIEDVLDENGDRAMVDFNKNKESIGGFESLSKWFRQYIATTTYVGKDIYGNTELKEGEPLLQAVDANRVYSGILKLVAGTDNIHEMLLRMQEIAQKKEYGYANEHSAHFIKRFFNDLGIVVTEDSYDVQKKEKIYLFNMVMKGLQQYRLDYIFFSKELGEKDTKIVLSNRRESKRKQFSIWYNAFGEVFFQKYKRRARTNQPKFLKEAIAGLEQYRKLARLGKITDEGLERQSREISEKLEKGLGMNMHPLFIQYSLLSPIKEENLTPTQLRLLQSLPPVEWMSPGDVEEFIQQLEDGKNPFVWNKDAADVEGDTEDDRGEAVTLTSRLMKFAESNALFDESVNVSSFTNADKETVYGHQLPTFHLLKVTELSNDLKDPNRYSDDAFLKDNFLVNREDLQQMAGDLKVARLDGMNSYYAEEEDFYSWKEGSKRKGVTYGDFTEREMLLALFELYGMNKGYKRADGSWFRTSRHLIRVLEASNTGDTVNLPVFKAVERNADGKIKLSAQALEALKQEVRREFDRIGQVKQEIAKLEEEKKTGKLVTKEIDGYHNGEKGNGPRGLTLFKTRIMLGALADEMEQEAQKDEANFDQFEERLEHHLKQYWIEGSEDTKSQLDQLIDTLKDRSIIKEHKGKLENVLLPQFMGTEVGKVEAYEQEGLFLELDQLKQNIAQVMMNDFINTQAFNQLLLGDQAESLVDYVDMVKRAKGANASGPSTAFDITAPELGIEHSGRRSHIVQIDDPKFFAKYANGWKEKADAQMWMTTKFLRYTLFGLGKLTPSQAALLDKIEHGESVNVQDIYGKGGSIEYDGQTNSIKLVYYDGKRYIKTSGFLLTKELTSRWDKKKNDWVARRGYEELHQLRDKMETFERVHQTICSAVPKSASKGEKANTARGIMPRMENGQLEDPITDWNFQELDNRYWRLQTENPSNKIEITDPTQAKQLILAEQDDAAKVYFPWSDKESPIRVGQLKKIYLETTAQRERVKYRQARNQIFSFEEALTEIKTSADLKKVTPKLEAFLKKAVDVLRISAADSQLLEFFSLDEERNPRYNLNHPATLDKFTQLFLAYFTKGVMNEKVPGHAATLVSNFGMRVIKEVLEVDEKGQPKRWNVITRAQYDQNPDLYEDALEWENDRREFLTLADKFKANKGRPSYILDDLRHNVPEYALNEDGTIKVDKKTGKEVILGYFSEYMMAPHDQHVMEHMGQFDGKIPDMISKSFGVRIPSQDKHSFINLKLVDFLPAHYGSSAVFPSELVEISGADFDVDKLYISTKQYYAKRNADDAIDFVEYGKVKGDKARFEEFVRYQKKNNRDFRRRYRELLAAHPYYQQWQNKVDELDELINNYEGDHLVEIAGKTLKFDQLKQVVGVSEDKLKEWKKSHKALIADLKQVQQEITAATLREFSLPDSVKAYATKVKNEGEQNIGVLNNMLVDAKIQLLGNEHMVEPRDGNKNPIAFEIASVEPLKQLVEDFKKIFKDVKSLMPILEEGNVDVDTFMGKLLAFRNNKEGAKNIGPAVNSMLAYALLNTFKVTMREHTSYENHKGETKNMPIWKFQLNGVEFNSYAHTRAYNPKTGKFDGERILHHISTIVSAMTDNAKERLAAKLGLNIEAVGLVSNLVAQGVPLDSAVMFMLQPVVRDYYKRTSNLSAAVKTEEEEDVNKYAIGENMLADLAKELGQETAEMVELTDDLLRDNILTEGKNKQYEYAVLDSFLKLRKQSEYFNDVSGVMKVVKGMQTSHESDDQLEEKINNLGLRDSDETFNRKYIPFDLRQVMQGVDKTKPFNNIIAEYLKNFDEIRLLSQKVFIERTEAFKHISDVIRKNLKVRGYQSGDFNKKLKRDLLSFLSIKAYMKILQDNNRLERLSSLTPSLLFDGEANKMGEDFKDVIDIVQEIRRLLPDNKFAKNFLNLVPTHIPNEDGHQMKNPYNRNKINRAEINTWAKLDALQIEQLQSSFLDILQNADTRKYAWALFHYLLVKDGGQFRNGSFIRYLPNAMFKDLQDATNKVNEVMIIGFEDGDFESVFGVQYFDLINEFVEGYLLNVTNAKYTHKVDIHLQTADLEYKDSSPISDFSTTKTELSKEEQKEVDDYVPQTFTVEDGDKTIEIDLTGGIREDPSQRGEYDKIEKAKYAKNVESLKLRGFRIGKMSYNKKTRTGDYDGKGKRNAVELPLVLRYEVMTEDGPKPVLYFLSELEDENGNWKSLDDDPTGIFQPDEQIARSTRARYVLYGGPEGHPALWGGSFMFGEADTSAFPRERKIVENYGGFDVDDETEPENEAKGKNPLFGTQLPNMAVKDFKEQFDVDSIALVDGALVFKKNGEEKPNQEFLYKAYRLLHDAYANKNQSPVTDDEDTDESSETSGSFYLDGEEDEGMNESPSAEEQKRYQAMVDLINEGPLGC